ncbi:hypothetical protein O6H91_15G011000 [Diphasiastrum complanatum]|nr:hypothetical protein O6H91_15G011000 [Diphasiastrum complanatum]
MREVKETFRRVAEVKRSGFSAWDDHDWGVRRGPTLSRNRQIRVRSLVPSRSLHLPAKVLKEIQNNRSVSPFVSFSHLQNVQGMCRRIQSQCSVTERRKNPFDVGIYPAFVRRPVSVSCSVDQKMDFLSPEEEAKNRKQKQKKMTIFSKAPLSYTPVQFSLLYDISNGAYPFCSFSSRRPPTSGGSSASSRVYRRFIDRPASDGNLNRFTTHRPEKRSSVRKSKSRHSSFSSTQSELSFFGSSASETPALDTPRSASGSEQGALAGQLMERPPSRCMNRPISGRSWESAGAVAANPVEVPALGDLSNRSTYSDAMPSARTLISEGNSGGSLTGSSATEESSFSEQNPHRSSLSANKLSDFSPDQNCAEMRPPSPSHRLCSRPPSRSVGALRSASRRKSFRRPLSASTSVKRFPDTSSASFEAPWLDHIQQQRPWSASFSYSGSMRRSSSNRVTFANPLSSLRDCPSSSSSRSRGFDPSNADDSNTTNRLIPSPQSSTHSGQIDHSPNSSTGRSDSKQKKIPMDSTTEGPENRSACGIGSRGTTTGSDGGFVEDSDVIVKHSTDPYQDFRASMMSMIVSEQLQAHKEELEDLFQYYLDLNPPVHHKTLNQVILDIREELHDKERWHS